MDMSCTLRREDSSAAGLLLRAWLHPADDSAEATAAALMMDWERGALEVCLAASACITIDCLTTSLVHARNAEI